MMRRPVYRWMAVMTVLGATVSLGATATFTPVGSPTAMPGTPVAFTVTVATEILGAFDSADIVIGSNDASDVAFAYSAAWESAFSNVTPPTADVGLYAQDIFVGGNHNAPVGALLVLGTATVDTTDMVEGTYQVRIDPGLAPDVSSLVLEGVHEDLQGAGEFTIACAFADPECDNDVDLADYNGIQACVEGPGTTASPACERYDDDGDGDVDLGDLNAFVRQFTGAK